MSSRRRKRGRRNGGRLNQIPATDWRVPSPDEVAAAQTPAGGWTRATLADWGVPWPPPKGWRAGLEVMYRVQAAGL
jgi:hypothetical protein